MELNRKLAILADAAKYDASCASSGTTKRNSRASGGLGSTTGTGICHNYTPDGRCVSLLKILLTNFCIYDCLYCINRVSSDVQRARFTPEEVVQLTLDFYRRNYCTACPLYKSATQTVFGECPKSAAIMFLGEQPGDQEDLSGKPFIGPAGKLLDRALEERRD